MKWKLTDFGRKFKVRLEEKFEGKESRNSHKKNLRKGAFTRGYKEWREGVPVDSDRKTWQIFGRLAKSCGLSFDKAIEEFEHSFELLLQDKVENFKGFRHVYIGSRIKPTSLWSKHITEREWD